MKRKTIALIIITLVFLFPFRWAFLEYPVPVKIANTMVDSGRVQYVFYFLLTIAGFLTFFILSVTDGTEKTKQK
jgi:heme/copper-type cytochrome/quinol oxidase subunit 1